MRSQLWDGSAAQSRLPLRKSYPNRSPLAASQTLLRTQETGTGLQSPAAGHPLAQMAPSIGTVLLNRSRRDSRPQSPAIKPVSSLNGEALNSSVIWQLAITAAYSRTILRTLSPTVWLMPSLSPPRPDLHSEPVTDSGRKRSAHTRSRS